ncbi:MAG TPA: prepilin-type N-terminal cleavage/methylation domain-containing protein [Vicinamibacterales bacterium]|nr:prepilin-type N-terminal cleavage/methylation domain-containing protein [Vicinamibacterales bacterium]
MKTNGVTKDERGFTIIELLISMTIMLGVTGVIFSLVDPARGTYRTQPEVSDLQQRLRVGTSFMASDLMMAGAGSPAGGTLMGSLMNFFAPVQPNRLGQINSDVDAGVFYRPDTITLMYIPPNAPQTSLSDPMPQTSSELKVTAQPNCPAGNQLCGFKEGQRILIFDDTGSYDDMTLTQVQTASLHLQHNKSVPGNDLSKKYGVGAQVAQVMQRTYYRNATTNQLMYYDGDQRDEAVVDNVVDLRFTYFGDPRPPILLKEVTEPAGPWTNYGPKPPGLGAVTSGWPAGENCAFLVDPGTGVHASRMADLSPNAEGLVPMPEAMLTDGPWCPDTLSPNRFDADLLRLRKIA